MFLPCFGQGRVSALDVVPVLAIDSGEIFAGRIDRLGIDVGSPDLMALLGGLTENRGRAAERVPDAQSAPARTCDPHERRRDRGAQRAAQLDDAIRSPRQWLGAG